MQGSTAIIGTGESVLAFQAGGVDAFPVKSAEEAKSVLRKLARTYKVILVTDDLCGGLETVISRTLETPYPFSTFCILPIIEAAVNARPKAAVALGAVLWICAPRLTNPVERMATAFTKPSILIPRTK